VVWGGGGLEPDQGVTSVEGNPATTSCMHEHEREQECFVDLAWPKTRTWLWVMVDDGWVDCNELYVVCGLAGLSHFLCASVPFPSLAFPPHSLLRSYGRSVET
jgi:hypothetical protein